MTRDFSPPMEDSSAAEFVELLGDIGVVLQWTPQPWEMVREYAIDERWAVAVNLGRHPERAVVEGRMPVYLRPGFVAVWDGWYLAGMVNVAAKIWTSGRSDSAMPELLEAMRARIEHARLTREGT